MGKYKNAGLEKLIYIIRHILNFKLEFYNTQKVIYFHSDEKNSFGFVLSLQGLIQTEHGLFEQYRFGRVDFGAQLKHLNI